MSPDPRPVPTTCSSCGEPLVEGKRFCEACGAAADGTAAGPSPETWGRT